MRQPRLMVRLVAAVLTILQTTGCGSAWQRPKGVTPADAVTTWHPDRIRVVRKGRAIELHEPAVQGDSLVGRVMVGPRPGELAVPRNDVVTFTIKGAGAVLTLRDSTVLEIAELWERGDSIGGPGVLPAHWEVLAIALADVSWIELRSPAATRLAPDGTVERPAALAPLVRGETVRVWLGDSRPPVERAVFIGVAGDSLIVSLDEEEQQIALASVSRIDRRTGRSGHAGWGLLIGLAVGGAAAAALVATADDNCDPMEPGYYQGCSDYVIHPQIAFAPVAVVMGGLVGFLAGAASRSDRWRTVPLDRAFPAEAREPQGSKLAPSTMEPTGAGMPVSRSAPLPES